MGMEEKDPAACLLVKLPVPLGATVWRICRNPAWNSGVESAELFLFGQACTPSRIVRPCGFSLAMLEEWGTTVFQTEEAAKAALGREG